MARLRWMAAGCALALLLGLPASTQALASAHRSIAATTGLRWNASIIPTGHFSVGSAVTQGSDAAGAGDLLIANGIDNYDTTCNGCSYDFVFFIFTNQAQRATITLKVLSPTGGTVYQTDWSANLYKGPNWYWTYAKGNYSAAGTYEVVVDGNAGNGNVQLGAVPLAMAS